MSPEPQSILVLKIGGNQVEDEAFLAEFVTAVKELRRKQAVVIVHGGGKEISDLHARLGVGFETVEGLRATSPQSMALVEMVLNGTVNTRLVRWLVNAGVEALGLSGVDMGLVRTTPMTVKGKSLGLVGQVAQVNGEALRRLLGLNVTPVISPVSLGLGGLVYNVNADQVAAGDAQAVDASQWIFVSNVPGVQVAGRTMPTLSLAQVEALIAEGHITGGMIPKVRSATDAVERGVYQAVITDLAGLAAGTGTAIARRATFDV
ncbi:MAG: acetylglutamate kinase [Anaerolineae bacterium]|nr:acetylglutamate kinase [Anaerolineae bacterium]